MRVSERVHIVVEVGPIVHSAGSKAQVAQMHREWRDALDQIVRDYLAVGKHSKTVRTRIVKEAQRR